MEFRRVLFRSGYVSQSLVRVKIRYAYNSTRGGNMIFHVTLERAEDGWIVAECPALPGCVSQGKDEKEALENIKEAITAWLWAEDQKSAAALRESSDHPPLLLTILA